MGCGTEAHTGAVNPSEAGRAEEEFDSGNEEDDDTMPLIKGEGRPGRGAEAVADPRKAKRPKQVGGRGGPPG